MFDPAIAKRRADGDFEGKSMEFGKRPKMDCFGSEKDVDCAPEGGSAGDNADNGDGVSTNLEGGDNVTDGDDSTDKAELPVSVSSAPMEAQVTPVTSSGTITKNAVAAATVEIDMYSAVSNVTADTPSAASADDLGCLENLPPIEKDVESHCIYDDGTLILELNTATFDHLWEPFLPRILEDYRADMAPHIRPASCGLHDLSKVDELIIMLVDNGLDRFTLSYTLVLDTTDPKSAYRPDHEPLRLGLCHGPHDGTMHEYLHNDEDCTRIRFCFQILEMAVYSLIFDVFTPTLAQASRGYKFRRAMGATNQKKLSPTAPPAILDFEPGMLSKHMFNLWMSGAEHHEFTCLIYRIQFSRQIDDHKESTEEFWLDDGTPLTPKDRDDVMNWRAFFEISEHYDLPSDVRNLLDTIKQCTHTDNIYTCPFTPHIDSGEALLTKEAIEIEKDWRYYCAKRSRDAADWESPSKQTIEAFLLERGVKVHKTDTERAG